MENFTLYSPDTSPFHTCQNLSVTEPTLLFQLQAPKRGRRTVKAKTHRLDAR